MSKKLINKSSRPKKTGPKFDPKAVTPEILLEWMDRRGLSEIEFDSENFHFRASKKIGMEFNPGLFSGGNSPSTNVVSQNNGANSTENNHLKKVLSPFVGTFYRSSNPESDPFVKEGQRINKGDTLCIVEAMKLMNEIEAEIQGRITAVLIENGQPVEFGEPLFLIDPDL
jgi:acetyl-CoA carboxylase biotin carboxyl carrier protein